MLNPTAKLSITSISAAGTLSLSIDGISADQAKTLGLTGLVLGIEYKGGKVACGSLETGHKISSSTGKSSKGTGQPSSFNEILSNAVKTEPANAYPPQLTSKQTEKEMLLTTSAIITDAGKEISKTLGDAYNKISIEIAQNIKSFQGKKIRGFPEVMASLKKITDNPLMKGYTYQNGSISGRLHNMNAKDMAFKLGNLNKGFKVADLALKIEKVIEKNLIGYNYGDWGPLMLEIESWVLSGMLSATAMGILSDVAPAVAATVGLPTTAIVVAGIIAISLIASLIDDKLVDKINKEVVRKVY